MISDQDLLLYHYRELEPAERARIGAALASQPDLAQRLHRLVARLDAAAAAPEQPVPPAIRLRWQAALERAARGDAIPTPHTSPRGGWLAAAAVVGVALVVGFQVLRPEAPRVARDVPAAPTSATPSPANTDASAYENGLKFHLASTERRIAALGEASPEERARLIAAIVSQNRLYALAAERAGEPQLARVLRAFTPVLESLATGGAEHTAADVARLGFELRVMQARLGAGIAPPANTL